MYKIENAHRDCINKLTKIGKKYTFTKTETIKIDYNYKELLILLERLENELIHCRNQKKSMDQWEQDIIDQLDQVKKLIID